ncbi:hypothetical protein CRUP_020439 [Coryphaenoides rupestris]|nr:hypothetical protein CRUP_020439 [Coryphaenoides rupestris]
MTRRLLMDKRVGLKRYEVEGRKVLFYFDEIPSQCMTCVSFQAVREYIVGKTAPVPVKVYDYYEPGGNQCNNVFGCLEEERYEHCACHRDCGYDGEPVCGSDGRLYQNQCQMEVSACRNSTRIEPAPPAQCPQSKSSSPSPPSRSNHMM